MGLNNVQTAILVVSIIFCFLSSLVVAVRLYDRKRIRKLPLAIDDYAILVSVVSAIAWTVTTILWVTVYGLGRPGMLDSADLREYRIVAYVNKLLYAVTFDVAKVAIILFYIKLTDRGTQVLYWNILACILGVVFFKTLLHILILAIPCAPVSDYWNHGTTYHTCWSSTQSATVINVFTFLTEILIVLAPIPLLWLAGLTRRQRIALAGMFSLGLLIIVATILKLRNVLSSQRNVSSNDYGIAWIWIAVESNTALLVAGVLPLKALLEARFCAVKRRFSSPDTSLDGAHEGGRNQSLVPSDPYDLDRIAPLHSNQNQILVNSPQSASMTLYSEMDDAHYILTDAQKKFGEV